MLTNFSFSGSEGRWKGRLGHSVQRFFIQVDASKHQATNFIAIISTHFLIKGFVSATLHNLLSAKSFLKENLKCICSP